MGDQKNAWWTEPVDRGLLSPDYWMRDVNMLLTWAQLPSRGTDSASAAVDLFEESVNELETTILFLKDQRVGLSPGRGRSSTPRPHRLHILLALQVLRLKLEFPDYENVNTGSLSWEEFYNPIEDLVAEMGPAVCSQLPIELRLELFGILELVNSDEWILVHFSKPRPKMPLPVVTTFGIQNRWDAFMLLNRANRENPSASR